MRNDAIDATWLGFKTALANKELDEAYEFAELLYNVATQMSPVYMVVVHEDHLGELNICKNTPEEFKQKIMQAYNLTSNNRKLLPKPVPEGTMEAMEETLSDEASNIEAIDKMTPYKELKVWAETDGGREAVDKVIATFKEEQRLREES